MSRKNKKNYIVLAFVCVLVLFAIFIGIYLSQNNNKIPEQSGDQVENTPVVNTPADVTPAEERTEFKIESVTEQGESVSVTTTYGTFAYPFAFSDLIVIEAVDLETTAQLKFFLDMDGVNVPIYTVCYNSEEGSLCGHLTLPDKEEAIPVSVILGEIPEDISEDWKLTFYATQETFNEVLFSMAEDVNFKIAE